MTYEEMPVNLPLISKKRLSVFYKLSPWRVRSTRKPVLHFRKSSLNSNVCIIDRSEVERLWPLDEKTTYNKIVYNNKFP